MTQLRHSLTTFAESSEKTEFSPAAVRSASLTLIRWTARLPRLKRQRRYFQMHSAISPGNWKIRSTRSSRASASPEIPSTPTMGSLIGHLRSVKKTSSSSELVTSSHRNSTSSSLTTQSLTVPRQALRPLSSLSAAAMTGQASTQRTPQALKN